MAATTADTLKNAVEEQLEQCRQSIHEGRANLSGLEPVVHAYCQAVAKLEKSEGDRHVEHLQKMMEEITRLGDELKEARESVHRELEGLGKLKQASVAYRKSDSIGPVHRRKQEDD